MILVSAMLLVERIFLLIFLIINRWALEDHIDNKRVYLEGIAVGIHIVALVSMIVFRHPII